MMEKDNLKNWMNEVGREELPANFTLNVINKIQATQLSRVAYTPILSRRGKIIILSSIFLIIILAIVLPSSGEVSGRLDPWFSLLPMITESFGSMLPSAPEGYNINLDNWNMNPIYGYGLLAFSMYLIFLSQGMGRRLGV